MSKDVTEYLAWSSSMEMDERHLMGIKTLLVLSAFLGTTFYFKKWKWSYVKHRFELCGRPFGFRSSPFLH